MYKPIAIFTVAVMLLTFIPLFPMTTEASPTLHRLPAVAVNSQALLLNPVAVRAAAKAAGLDSLSTIPVPLVPNLGDFLNPGSGPRTLATVLGKALFWDQQVGSDGQACASCHFAAGADNRTKNQLNPGLRASPTDNTFGNSALAGVTGFTQFAPNAQLAVSDFATHKLAEPDKEDFLHRVVTRDTNDVVSSQGNFNATFTGTVVGQLRDNGTAVADPVFKVGDVNVRRVPPRNAPSVINAVFNFDNFWDGRARNQFNGVSPLGFLDTNAKVLVNNAGTLTETAIVIPNSSLASQAVGPVLSDLEMSFVGRTFPDVGKKLLAAKPLVFQNVHVNDSVMGPFAVTGAGAKGLTFATYLDIVKTVFQSKYWDSTNVITFPGGVRTINPSGTPGGYTQAEANFTLFFGLAVQAYESTLVSDKTRLDRFMEGDNLALDQDEMKGLLIFINQGGGAQATNPIFTGISKGACTNCHGGPEFTDASVASVSAAAIAVEPIPVLINGRLAVGSQLAYVDEGYYNIGVRPTNEDLGRGGVELGKPLSFTRQKLANLSFAPPLPPGTLLTAIQVDGAFKTPGLRNVELTGPYFHNGGAQSLRDVIDFYGRHGDHSDSNLPNIDSPLADVSLRPVDALGRDPDGDSLMRFLLTLTDERVRNEMSPFDHPAISVPNGHPGDKTAVTQFTLVNGVKVAADTLLEIPAVGRDGRQSASLAPLKPFLSLGAIPQLVRLHSGWNTLSTPIKLHSTMDTWGEFATANGLSFQIAYSWSGTAFVATDPAAALNPLDSIYVLMNAQAAAEIVPFEGVSSPPSKALTVGWNLVGSAFLDTEMPVKDALTSAFFAPSAGANATPQWGYSQVMSPAANLTPWAYVRDSAVIPKLQLGEGYWVSMVNAGQLSGFTSTPLPR